MGREKTTSQEQHSEELTGSNEPSEKTGNPDMVFLVLVGSFLFSLYGGFLGSLTCALLGALTVQISAPMGELAASLAGSLVAATVGVLTPRLLARSVKPWRETVFWIPVALALLFALDQSVPGRFDWPMYRWAIGGAGLGMVLGGYYEPIRLARGGELVRLKQNFRLIAFTLASLIKSISRQRLGCVLSGALGSGLGALCVSAMLAQVHREEVQEWLGSSLVIPFCGTGLGLLSGALTGARAWGIAMGEKQAPEVKEINDHGT